MAVIIPLFYILITPWKWSSFIRPLYTKQAENRQKTWYVRCWNSKKS